MKPVDQQTTDCRAGHQAQRGGNADLAETTSQLMTREDRGDQSRPHGHHHRGTHCLDKTEKDEHVDRLGKVAEQGANGKDECSLIVDPSLSIYI